MDSEQVGGPVRVYLAAPWVCREQAASVALQVEQEGFVITEPWWLHKDSEEKTELQEQALLDIAGVLNAEIMLLLNSEKSEGKAVETGIAISSGIPVIVVGEPSNLFHHLLVCVPTVDDAIALMKGVE